MDVNHPETANVIGTKLSLLTTEQILAAISGAIAADEHLLMLSGNIYSFNLAYENPWLRTFMNSANVVRLDGAGVALGARLLGYHPPKRSTWADLAWELAEHAEAHGHTLYFLGAAPGVALKAAENLTRAYPLLQVVGVHHGYFDKQVGDDANEAVIREINQIRPHILVVGFGMPLQEKWLLENKDRLDVRVIMTGGAVFDYVSGELQRGPRWMTEHGLEWLARLMIDPVRLWQRYVIGNPVFMGRVLRQRLRMRTALQLDDSSSA